MRTIQIQISETDFQQYNLNTTLELKFTDLIEKITLEYARQSLKDSNSIA